MYMRGSIMFIVLSMTMLGAQVCLSYGCCDEGNSDCKTSGKWARFAKARQDNFSFYSKPATSRSKQKAQVDLQHTLEGDIH